MRRNRSVLGLIIGATVGLSAALTIQVAQADTDNHQCDTPFCRGSAGCSGKYFDMDPPCHVTCYDEGPNAGEIHWVGEADCGPQIQ